jgi:hypothetical protein
MILLGYLAQVKGFGFALVSSRKRWMASLSSRRERNTPRLRRFLVSFAKKLSTALSQEADVGVKWKTNRDGFRSILRILMLVRDIVVDDHKHRFLLATLASMTLRQRMNYRWRWSCVHWAMTLPSSTSSTAGRVVAP